MDEIIIDSDDITKEHYAFRYWTIGRPKKSKKNGKWKIEESSNDNVYLLDRIKSHWSHYFPNHNFKIIENPTI